MCLLRLDDIIINKNASSITLGDEEISLEPKLFELLLLFCQYPNEIISRQTILENIWPESLVTDNAVNKLVASLRKTLNDEAKSPRFIQTVPKRGYRLMVDVEEVQLDKTAVTSTSQHLDLPTQVQNDGATVTTESFNSPNSHHNKHKRNQKLAVLTLLSVVIILAYVVLLWRPSPLEATAITPLSTPLSTMALTRMPGLERSALMSHDQSFILYLREDRTTGHRSLWHKNLSDHQEQLISGLSPFVSHLIAIEPRDNSWELLYLAQESATCQVASVTLNAKLTLTTPTTMFDCSNMRIFDVAWSSTAQGLYYTAQAKNETLTRVYFYDSKQDKHRLITQPDAFGIGNRGIDLSPNEQKLLIVNLDNDFNSQLHVLNLSDNTLLSGLKTNYNIKKATWSHDSQHIMFHNPAPSHQIILSDINGYNQQTIVSVSEYLETEFTRIKDSKDILFSTTNLNFNNRWVSHAKNVKSTSDSTVYDMQPTLAHTSEHYAFVSTRSGQEQLYYGDLTTGNSRAITRLKSHRWLKHLAFSPNDKFLLAGDRSRIWLIDLATYKETGRKVDLLPENTVFETKGYLLDAHWLNNDYLYFKRNLEGQISSFIFHRQSQNVVKVDERWQTLLTDHKNAAFLYMVDPADLQLYKMPMNKLPFTDNIQQLKFPETAIEPTNTHLGDGYFGVKIHDGLVYYVTQSNSGNSLAYDFQIEIKPLSPNVAQHKKVVKTSCSCGFDVADSGFMISEQVAIEGDIHRTIQ